MQSLLTIKNIKKTYGKTIAIENLSIDVCQGEIFGIIGPNGSGKTTLLKCIAGLLKINEGSILLNVPGKSNEIKMGILLEQSFYPYLSVYGNVLHHLLMYHKDRRTAKEEIEAYLSQYNLMEKRNQKPHKLSLGMRQRLSLIMALIHEPDIVLLDEPDLGMDIVNLKHLMETLKDLSNKKTTVIISSHNISNVVMLADKVCLLGDGAIKCIKDIDKQNLDNDKSYLEDMFVKYYPGKEV